MAIKKNVEAKLNEQINAEFWSAYLYLSMSNYLVSDGKPGFANWMRIQYEEEISHAMRMMDYVNERGGRVLLKSIADVPSEWTDLMEVFKETLGHEEKVTSLINECVDVAMSEHDHATCNFLQWYIMEQVEEEANVNDILDKLSMVGASGHGLYMMDKEMAARVFTPPVG